MAISGPRDLEYIKTIKSPCVSFNETVASLEVQVEDRLEKWFFNLVLLKL